MVGAAVACKVDTTQRAEGAFVNGGVVSFPDDEVVRRVDRHHTIDDGRDVRIDGGHQAVAKGVIQLDLLACNGHHVLVEHDLQIGHRGNGVRHLADDGQRRVVEAQSADGTGAVVAQAVGVFDHRLEADIDFDSADGRCGCECPVGTRHGGCTQAGSAHGVVNSNHLACGQGAGDRARQGGRGVVAVAVVGDGAGDHTKVVGDAGKGGARLGHIGHSL